MLRILIILGLLVGFSELVAAPHLVPAPDGNSSANPGEAQQYAESLGYAMNVIQEGYVRQVFRSELVSSSVAGLYEAARVPMPRRLQTQLHQLSVKEGLPFFLDLATARFQVIPLIESIQNKELTDLLVQARENLGDLEVLRGQGDLLASVRAICKNLDPYSGLVTGQELQKTVYSETSHGLGIETADHVGKGPLVVKSVAAGGPGQRAGIRPDDQITHINGKAVDEQKTGIITLAKFTNPDLGNSEPAACKVCLTVLRPGAPKPRQVTLETETFKAESILGVSRREDNSWYYFLDRKNKIAQVRIASLAAGTADELRQVLTGLQAEKMKGLVLDLRWCPGGMLDEAVAVAELFLGECLITTIQGRHQGRTEYRSHGQGGFLDFPIIVLINAETSGGAELIAAALEDHQRASLAGQRTRGKASIQKMEGLPVNNFALKMTTGTFIRPSGKNIHRFPDSRPTDPWGVHPDPKLELRTSPELNRKLKEWWLLQTLRPGPSNESQPLDDPEVDPVRQFAWQILKEKIR